MKIAARADSDRSAQMLLDTHVLMWIVFGDSKLGRQARKVIDLATLEGRLLVSAISAWEVGMLASKKRIDLQQGALEWVQAAFRLPGVNLAPLSPEIAVTSSLLPFEIHSDPADRILVATARHLGATLVTADRALLDIARQRQFMAIDAAV